MPPIRPSLLSASALALALAAAACDRPPAAVTKPVQVSESPFQYPEELWDAGVEGVTTLRLFVTDGGQVDSAQVERSSGYPAFDSAALAGSRDLKFEPARRGEKPIGGWVSLPVEFNLPGGSAPSASGASSPAPADTTAARSPDGGTDTEPPAPTR